MARGRPATAWATRIQGGRTPEIDITLPGLGLALGTGRDRIRIASGTREESVYHSRVRLLRQLWLDADHNPGVSVTLIRALIARDVRIADLERTWRDHGEAGLLRLVRSLRSVSLATAITGFLASEECPKKSQAAYRNQLADFAAYAEQHVAKSPLAAVALDATVIKAYLRQLTAKSSTRRQKGSPVSPGTRNRYRAVLSGLCSYGVREGWLATHPMILGQVPLAEEPPPRLPDLTSEEVGLYLAGVDQWGDEERALAIRTLLHSGGDVGEILTRKVAHLLLDGTSARLKLKRQKVRSSPERLVPLPDYLTAWLRGWIAANGLGPRDLLFPGMSPRRLERAHDAGVKACGHDDLTMKDLRHLAAQAWRQAGVDLQTIQGWLGHATLQQTSVYTAYAPLPAHERPLIEKAAELRPGISRVFTRTGIVGVSRSRQATGA